MRTGVNKGVVSALRTAGVRADRPLRLAPSTMAQGQGREEQRVFSAWIATPDEVAEHHGVDIATGLTASQIAEKRAQYGYNELEKEPGKSLLALVLEQFDDMLVKVSP